MRTLERCGMMAILGVALLAGEGGAARTKPTATAADTTCKSLRVIVRDGETGDVIRDAYAFLALPKWEDPYWWHRYQATPTLFSNLPVGYAEFRVIAMCHRAATVSKTILAVAVDSVEVTLQPAPCWTLPSSPEEEVADWMLDSLPPIPTPEPWSDSARGSALGQKTGSLLVLVEDGEDEKPLYGANVVVLETRIGGISDRSGFTVVTGVTPGIIRLRTLAPGYLSRVDSLVVKERNGQVYKIRLARNRDARR
jgi:hypothetical protein